MPFSKRVVQPQRLCRRTTAEEEEAAPLEDLGSVSSAALSRSLLQLSDLARHACSVFQELEDELVAAGLRVCGLQSRITGILQVCGGLDPRQEAVPVSNLDVESKLTVHYGSPWLLQRNIFRPSTRPACVVDLHRQANLSLAAVHQEHQRRRSGSRERRVTISISAVPPMPMYPPALVAQQQRGTDLTSFDSTRSSSPTECCRFSPWSRKAVTSDPDADGVALGHRHKFPIPNTPTTLDKQTNWSRALPLPTPEERMKSSSQVINSCVIPINVTGVGFDRDASVRCSLVHSQSVLQRRRKLRRRRTVAGVPDRCTEIWDSNDSPGSRERTVIVHSPDVTPSTDDLDAHLGTRDSGCQTEDFLISGAPSRRRIRSQRGQTVSLSLSHSAGNILFLSDSADAMFSASVGDRLRSRSLPRDGRRMMVDEGHSDDDEEEELSPFDAEDFLPGPGDLLLKDGEESVGDRAASDRQLGRKYKQLPESPERSWMERTRSRLPRKADMGSCEISSSSDTFSSPVHSVSAAGVQMDHKDDHQSSSGNWSGSSSTCPSQTSETILPAASPPLTGSSHCDSELSLNAAAHNQDDHAGFLLDHYQGLRTQRAGSFSSTAMDILEEAGVGAPVEEEWRFPDADQRRPRDFSPEPNREAESSLGCPSFTSMATCESSFSDKPPSDTVSHYSVDTEGYYTSMHFDCGMNESRSFSYGCSAPGSESDFGGHMTLGRRCLSLKKPKAKPCPPKRSSSLRKICSEGHIPDNKEPKMSSKERKLQLVLSNSSLSREPLVVWGVEDSADLPDLGVFSATDVHSFKDEGVVQSDYADLWLLNDLKSSDPYRSLSNSSTATGTTVIECIKSQESSESQTSLSGSRATTPSLPSVEDFKLTSPEKLAGLASPSSGYSSQSETPTSSFPAAFFPGPMSPSSGKRKPKVPERKSSLSTLSLQSLSSSRRDLELPIIPPSHLDLSALHAFGDKSSAYRTPIQNLQQNKPKAPVLPKPAYPMFITPSALHSVQLRSVAKENGGRHEDKTTPTLTCSNENLTSILSCSTSAELKSPSRPHHPPTEGSCESAFTSNKELANGECRNETRCALDREEAPLIPQSETTVNGDEEEMCRESAETPEALQLQRREEEKEEEEAALSVQHSSTNGLDTAAIADGQSEALKVSPISDECRKEEECESPDASAQNGSQDGKDESTTEAEDYFSRDSTTSVAAASPQIDESRPEDDAVFLSPTKTRTTEDLFAMIHRSKRKVLGRKDSTELNVRNRIGAVSGNTPPSSTGSSPVSLVSPSSSSSTAAATAAATAATAAVTPPGLHRVSGPIYRSAKKSSTSNEEFKLLLLKKGSRSESSYRMSAAEILKSPVTPKSSSDSLMESPRPTEDPDSPLQHQSGPDQLSSPYPKAYAEGFSPKSFSSPTSSRHGRSRIPPPANSSRYGARSRLYSVPMQAISEGEAENSDGSPHDDRSSQGST
ncbi:actin remodeling regulator NHS [Anoplopoma fimbria]|uniref:actin remodeling regulator NHS n=1 Tax=Anoplopoma fimbria TaxID=229290 RepID=UPI0023EADAF2|nr:actin remodeling regulator NHS [Anoplopoma fimbria]